MKNTFAKLCGMGRREYELTVDGTLHEYVNNNRPTGVNAMGVFFGIALWLLDGAGDECIAAWAHGDSFTGAHRHTIHYSSAGRPFIKKGNSRYYFDEFIRV